MSGFAREKASTAGLCWARTDDGRRLPVLDFTHPAFRVETDPALREARAEALRAEAGLFRGLAGRRPEDCRPASGLRTYCARLGRLGLGWARFVPFLRSADGFWAEALRVRTSSLAHLLAAGMVPAMAKHPAAPLHLVNLAGGAAADSLNALLLLARDRPFLVEGRVTHVHVLDADAAAPHYAARALAALRAPGGPLARVEATLDHVPWSWDDAGALAGHLARWRAEEPAAVMAGSSEGGLLEYAPDEVVRASLRALRAGAPPGFVLAASAWRDDEPARSARGLRGADQPLRAHSRASLRALADQEEWNVQWSQDDDLLHHLVLLRPR